MGKLVSKSAPSVSAALPATTDKLPIEVSADGTRNAYTHYCDAVEHRIHYASCLKRIEDEKAGVTEQDPDCRRAMKHGRCPAKNMFYEEAEKGHAIYFLERVRQGDILAKAMKLLTPSRQESTVTIAEPVVKSVEIDLQHGDGVGDYADVVNDMMVASRVTVASPNLGGGFLEVARRALASKINQA